MAGSRDERHAPPPSRLGRGLGNLIPVPIQRPSDDGGVPNTRAGASIRADSGHGADPSRVERPSHAWPAAPHSARTAEVPASPLGDAGTVQFVPLRSLRAGKYQPRATMDAAGLEALAASIAASGLMQPIVVRPAPDGAGQYEVIAGERRWRALERLGKQEAPVIVRTVGDQEAAELGLVENLQREDLNPMDRAAALRRLADEFGLTHQNLAARIGLDRATVTNLLRLTELDPETAGLVREGALSAGHARVLVGISDVARRCGLAALAAREGWSVRHLEERARDASVPRGTSARRTSATQSAHAARLERQLQEHLGTRVSLRLTRKKGVGELRIRFFSLDEFDGIMQRMGFRGDEGQLRV